MPEAKLPAPLAKEKVVGDFVDLMIPELPTSLERLVLMLRKDQAEIADRLPLAKHVELASGFLTVLSVDIGDLVPLPRR